MAAPWEKYAASSGPWDRYKDPSSAPMDVDPAADMSTLDKLRAGIGRGMSSIGRGALQAISAVTGANDVGAGLIKDSDIAEAKKLDAALLATGAGKVGNVAGMVAGAIPAALLPGANTYLGAAAIGAGTGALTTEGDSMDRLAGTLGGLAGGPAGKFIGDKLGAAARWAAEQSSNRFAQTQAANAGKAAAARAANEAGYVIPPADLQPGVGTELLSSLSGKIKTAQEASARNQATTNNLAKQALGLDELSAPALLARRAEAGASGYAPVRNAGEVIASPEYAAALDGIAGKYAGAARSFPGAAKNDVVEMVDGLRQAKFNAGDAVDMIKVLRESADSAFRRGETGLGKASKEAASALESELERHLASSGNPGALEAFRKAREEIAKTYTLQKALNAQTGDVSAPVLARELAKGRPLSDELLTIAQVAQAFPKATQALKEAPKAWSPLDIFAGGLGTGMGSPVPALLAASRPVARHYLLSPVAQRAAINAEASAPMLTYAGLLDNDALQASMPGIVGLLSARFSAK